MGTRGQFLLRRETRGDRDFRVSATAAETEDAFTFAVPRSRKTSLAVIATMFNKRRLQLLISIVCFFTFAASNADRVVDRCCPSSSPKSGLLFRDEYEVRDTDELSDCGREITLTTLTGGRMCLSYEPWIDSALCHAR